MLYRARLLLGFILGSLGLSLAATHAAENPPQHALWSLKGKTNTVYLLGSVHFLSPSEQLPAAMNAAYEEAEVLLMEIDMDDLDPVETQRTTLRLGVLPAGQSLSQIMGPDLYPRLAQEARRLGVPSAQLERMRPWLAGLTLAQLNLIKMGLDPNSGVERRLTARAGQDGKEILGLETIEEQFSVLAQLSPQRQREFLMYSIEDTSRATREIQEMLGAWRSGDMETLGALLTEGYERYPDIYRPLTVQRNERWIPKLESLLDDKDDYLVVVGALHLVGKDSVVELLQSAGHEVQRH